MLHSHANEDDDEEMNTDSKSSLLRENRPAEGTEGIPFCGCLSVKFYQPYFDLDTQDVYNRIWSSLFFCRRQDTFLDSFATKTPDAYGPFWVHLHIYS
jgi:hypothetical protein